MGRGKIMVEFFSADIELRVWNKCHVIFEQEIFIFTMIMTYL